jgi:hypothetical protein
VARAGHKVILLEREALEKRVDEQGVPRALRESHRREGSGTRGFTCVGQGGRRGSVQGVDGAKTEFVTLALTTSADGQTWEIPKMTWKPSHMSAYGTKRTCSMRRRMSASGG